MQIKAGQAKKFQDRLAELLTRSATDLAFRQRLLATPRQAVEELFGGPVDARFNVRFIESSPGSQTIVLPDPVQAATELTPQELESVAGGTWYTPDLSMDVTVVSADTGTDTTGTDESWWDCPENKCPQCGCPMPCPCCGS